MRKYFTKTLGSSLAKVLDPMYGNDPVISSLRKNWSNISKEQDLLPYHYCLKTKTLFLRVEKNQNLISFQYKSQELIEPINFYLGFVAVKYIKINQKT
ncbi:hypothetical protein [Candidatus Nesciobacter abundans]|uniref:DUF721 domain-containing protein n=1 Tax=Candidatus Nesciobacter abundans TaxID=2601668 RepID=A0A5C0UHN1_9PROT|nr:hypothetical protein [Candidatus Nesciobacter abundans]QEK38852.1 hypothetical protein FZC36_00125 [Candidatus Nesciobacter abundans]